MKQHTISQYFISSLDVTASDSSVHVQAIWQCDLQNPIDGDKKCCYSITRYGNTPFP